MKREIYEKLLEWKSRRDHKPLVLDGARQVGKTYIIRIEQDYTVGAEVVRYFHKEKGAAQFLPIAMVRLSAGVRMPTKVVHAGMGNMSAPFRVIGDFFLHGKRLLLSLDFRTEAERTMTFSEQTACRMPENPRGFGES